MRCNVRWNSIIEVMVVMLVLTTGIVGAYGILSSGQTLAATTENRIKAVNIAREGIEAVENIRNTNWIKFSSNYNGCYDVDKYEPLCIWAATGTYSIKSGSYIAGIDNTGLWTLSGVTTVPSYSWATRAQYMALFPVYFDSNGLIAQTGTAPTAKCVWSVSKNCNSIFSREIKITRPGDYSSIQIDSIVTWADSTRADPYVITLSHTLKNWKYNYYQK